MVVIAPPERKNGENPKSGGRLEQEFPVVKQ
jgi:hypothetical protein